jgi:hypothetical protein
MSAKANCQDDSPQLFWSSGVRPLYVKQGSASRGSHKADSIVA